MLAEHGELRMFPSIVKHFEEIMKTHHNEVQVHVASAEVCQPFALLRNLTLKFGTYVLSRYRFKNFIFLPY